jgi:hypothetical protein
MFEVLDGQDKVHLPHVNIRDEGLPQDYNHEPLQPSSTDILQT